MTPIPEEIRVEPDAQEARDVQRALELSVQIGTPRHDVEEVDVSSGAAGSGTTSTRREAELEHQVQLETALAASMLPEGQEDVRVSMRDAEKRLAPEPTTPPGRTVAESIAHFEQLGGTPKKAKTVAGVADLRGPDTTVEENTAGMMTEEDLEDEVDEEW
eukprot:1465867-Amphidinium_carterae.1